jgi:hypothetical protein
MLKDIYTRAPGVLNNFKECKAILKIKTLRPMAEYYNKIDFSVLLMTDVQVVSR